MYVIGKAGNIKINISYRIFEIYSYESDELIRAISNILGFNNYTYFLFVEIIFDLKMNKFPVRHLYTTYLISVG